MSPIRTAVTPCLEIAYEEHGSHDGVPVVLLHGFPYDPRCYGDVVGDLAQRNFRVIVPYLRGYGGTRFLSADRPRSGQQAALAQDLVDLLDALSIPRAHLAGYDWGGRAACIVAALWPDRVMGLVSGGGYNIQDIAAAARPQSPETEYRNWYQYYFNTERGRLGLAENRQSLGRLLWRLWSPSWVFDDATYERSAASFDNPDFVEVVIHSYRHRYGYAPGDPAYAGLESQLAATPRIRVPAIALFGLTDGVSPPHEDATRHENFFIGPYESRLLADVGHNIPQEAPEATVRAILDLADLS